MSRWTPELLPWSWFEIKSRPSRRGMAVVPGVETGSLGSVSKKSEPWLLVLRLIFILGSLGLWLPSAQDAVAAETKPIDPELLEKIRRSNAECFSCHTEAGLKHPPRTDLDLVKLKETLHDPDAFKRSNHGNMECKQCHGQGFNDYPHVQDALDEVSPCEECHAAQVLKVEMQFDNSVHARKLRDQFTCNSCHDPHTALIAAKLGDPRKIVRQDNEMCLDCHNSDLQFAKLAPDQKKRPDIDRIHEWLPNPALHWRAVRCLECHTPVAKTLSHEILDKEKAEKRCVSCHTTNTSLASRLYRHMAKDEQQQYGFLNSVILSNSYIVGATRHPLIDQVVIALVTLTLLGVLLHGVIRIAVGLIRRTRKGS